MKVFIIIVMLSGCMSFLGIFFYYSFFITVRNLQLYYATLTQSSMLLVSIGREVEYC